MRANVNRNVANEATRNRFARKRNAISSIASSPAYMYTHTRTRILFSECETLAASRVRNSAIMRNLHNCTGETYFHLGGSKASVSPH